MKRFVVVVFFCLAWAFAANDLIATQLAVFDGLDLKVPILLRAIPVFGAIVSFLIILIGVQNKRTTPWLQFIRRNRLIERYLFTVLLWCTLGLAPGYYREYKLAKISIPPQSAVERRWPQFQSSLDFKVTWQSSSSSPNEDYIYFEKGPGRIEKVEALLAKTDSLKKA